MVASCLCLFRIELLDPFQRPLPLNVKVLPPLLSGRHRIFPSFHSLFLLFSSEGCVDVHFLDPPNSQVRRTFFLQSVSSLVAPLSFHSFCHMVDPTASPAPLTFFRPLPPFSLSPGFFPSVFFSFPDTSLFSAYFKSPSTAAPPARACPFTVCFPVHLLFWPSLPRRLPPPSWSRCGHVLPRGVLCLWPFNVFPHTEHLLLYSFRLHASFFFFSLRPMSRLRPIMSRFPASLPPNFFFLSLHLFYPFIAFPQMWSRKVLKPPLFFRPLQFFFVPRLPLRFSPYSPHFRRLFVPTTGVPQPQS